MGQFRGALQGLEWDEKRGVFFSKEANPSLEALMDRDYERAGGTRCWSAKRKDGTAPAAAPRVTLAERVEDAVSVTRSVVSGRNATEEVITRRALSCFGSIDGTTPPCPAMVIDRDGMWCGRCRCNRRKLAELSNPKGGKLTFTYLTCPLKRPGFSNSA